MATSRTWAIVLCSALAAMGACKKKTEEAPAPVPTPVVADAGAAAAPEAATSAAPEAGTEAALAEAGTAPRPGGGGSLLAGLLGGGRGAASEPAPAAASSAPGLEAVRDMGRSLMAREDEPAFGRAVEAAQLANELKAAGAAAPAGLGQETEPAAPTGPAVPPPDEADPCASLIPSMMRCLAEEFGEALSAEDAMEAMEECRKEYGEWPAERQAALRGCNAVSGCGATMECIAALAEDDEDVGDDDGEDDVESVELPSGADVCTKMVIRSAQCAGVGISADDLGPSVEECRKGMADMPAEAQAGMAACMDQGCDEMWDCMGAMDAGVGDDVVDDGGDDMFGAPPDPARVATLPAATRELCAMLPASLDRCWDALIGAAAGDIDDPATVAMIASMKDQLLSGVGNMCLGAALDDPDSFGEMNAARPCLSMPCDQMLPCIEQLSGE